MLNLASGIGGIGVCGPELPSWLLVGINQAVYNLYIMVCESRSDYLEMKILDTSVKEEYSSLFHPSSYLSLFYFSPPETYR